MRLPLLRRAAALVAAPALLLGAAACGGDDEEPAAPTTTSPATTEATEVTATPTTEDGASSTTSAPPTTVPGTVPPPDAVTPAYAEGVLADLMEQFRSLLVQAKAADRFDEAYFRGLAAIYTSTEGRRQTSGLQQLGGIAVIRPDAQPVTLGEAQMLDATDGCISFVMDPVDFAPLVTMPLSGSRRTSVRLVASSDGAGGPWRIGYLSSAVPTGLDPEAACS